MLNPGQNLVLSLMQQILNNDLIVVEVVVIVTVEVVVVAVFVFVIVIDVSLLSTPCE